MATIPLAPILPEINTSANIALSRWNEMIKQGQEQFADYLASMVRLGQVGASNVVDAPLSYYNLSYSPYNLFIPDISIKIGEFFNKLGAVGNKLIPNELRSSSCLIAVVVFEFNFEHIDTTVTGTDGQTIPVESNYDSVSNYYNYQYGLFDGRDFGDFSGGTTFDGWYHFGSGTKETGLFHTLADTQGSETNTKFFVSGINVNQTSVTQISSGSIKFAIPFAILTTSDSWSTVNILKTFNPHDIDNSYPDMVWSIPTIYDQIVAGNTGLSNVVNSFPVKLEKSGKTITLEGDNITLEASNKSVKLSIDTSSNLSNIQISDTTGLNDINLNVYGNVVGSGSIEAAGDSLVDADLSVSEDLTVGGGITGGSLSVTGNASVSGNLTVEEINAPTGGDLTINPDVTLASLVNFQGITTGLFGFGYLYPSTDGIGNTFVNITKSDDGVNFPYSLPSGFYVRNNHICILNDLYYKIETGYDINIFGINSSGTFLISQGFLRLGENPVQYHYAMIAATDILTRNRERYVIIPIINKTVS